MVLSTLTTVSLLQDGFETNVLRRMRGFTLNYQLHTKNASPVLCKKKTCNNIEHSILIASIGDAVQLSHHNLSFFGWHALMSVKQAVGLAPCKMCVWVLRGVWSVENIRESRKTTLRAKRKTTLQT